MEHERPDRTDCWFWTYKVMTLFLLQWYGALLVTVTAFCGRCGRRFFIYPFLKVKVIHLAVVHMVVLLTVPLNCVVGLKHLHCVHVEL